LALSDDHVEPTENGRRVTRFAPGKGQSRKYWSRGDKPCVWGGCRHAIGNKKSKEVEVAWERKEGRKEKS
jgi:hypothetical protein